jgi:hypothetical protein
VGSGRVVGDVNRVLFDTEGHAQRAYDVDAQKALPLVVIIRPDTCIGVFEHDAEGVEKYFSKIFV